jgi:DNA-binding NarL/FixJ family response regulator
MRVLAVADSSQARAGLAALVDESDELDLVGSCGLEDAVRVAGVLEPDAVVLAGRSEGRPLADIVALAGELPVPVIVLSGADDLARGRAGSAEAREELIEPLTRRELDVLQLLASGLTNRRIAHALEISEHTVKFHVTSILGKLGATTRTEAVTTAAHHGLILV